MNELIAAAIAGLGGTIVGAIVGRRKNAADGRLAEAEADSASVSAAEKAVNLLRSQVEAMAKELRELSVDNSNLRARVDDCESDRRDLHRQIEGLRSEVEELKRERA